MKKAIVLLICFASCVFLFGQSDTEEYRDMGGTVVIPNNIIELEDGAFSGNRNIVVVNIPAGVTRIGAGAFRGCERLTAVTMMSGVSIIGEYAFASCKSLTAIIIPVSVTDIGTGAFSGCATLRSVIMSRKTRLAPDVFKGAPVNILYID
ncbi:hypothetical protein AGMMS49587_03990 [Spirochaetia bacterium]|nr:hypothetical protein AGMMS49587_03990 [Spirochaetia bacterium]